MKPDLSPFPWKEEPLRCVGWPSRWEELLELNCNLVGAGLERGGLLRNSVDWKLSGEGLKISISEEALRAPSECFFKKARMAGSVALKD